MPNFWIERSAPGRLAIIPRPRGGDWLADEIHLLRRDGIDVIVSLLTQDEREELGLAEEERACVDAGISYRNLAIEDRSIPTSHNGVQNLIEELSALLKEGKAIGIHCRGSIGRSSLLAACLLVHEGIDCGEALRRIRSARGCEVPETESQRMWIEKYAASQRTARQ